VRLERVARNWDSSSAPDNAGDVPRIETPEEFAMQLEAMKICIGAAAQVT
jgi:hypothetical protein